MPTTLGQRSGAVYREKSQKHAWLVFTVMVTLLIIYCKFDWLISNVCVLHCLRRLPPMPLAPGSNLGGVCFLFLKIYLKGLCHGLLASLLTAKISICFAGKARQIMAYFF